MRVFHSLGVHGLTAVTAVTAQSSGGVLSVFPVPAKEVALQLEVALRLPGVASCKTGMLWSADTVEAVAQVLRPSPLPLVVDPVFRAKDGTPLLSSDGIRLLGERLLPLASIVTPNLDEAEVLTGRSVRTLAAMADAAREIGHRCGCAVLIKGGHLEGEPVDVFFNGTAVHELPGPRTCDSPVRGTGCLLSAAIVALLALGQSLDGAVREAKGHVSRWIGEAACLGPSLRVAAATAPVNRRPASGDRGSVCVEGAS